MKSLSRRTVLIAAGGTVLAGRAANMASAREVHQRAKVDERRFLAAEPRLSENGWAMEDTPDESGGVWSRTVPGTTAQLALRIGDAEMILLHVLRRFHYEIQPLLAGDVVGHVRPQARFVSLFESNHASGTAVDIKPLHYPIGVRGGFFPHEILVLRDILAECDGTIRWGGDLRGRSVHEAHFQIDVAPDSEHLVDTAARIRGWRELPQLGAGTFVDATNTDRREAARRMEARQAVA